MSFMAHYQGIDEVNEFSSNHLDGKQLLDGRHPSPVSILEPSFSTESCNSSDTADSSITEGKTVSLMCFISVKY